MLNTPSSSTFSVYELNTQVKRLLENGIGQVWLIGEISNFTNHTSGHWYFTLKDERSQVRCAMFKGSNSRVGFIPKHGQEVLVQATVTLYEARGDYQLIVNQLKLSGEGILQRRYELLKKKLEAEQLFDASFKKPLPSDIQRVGVITSPSGAALKDICQILNRRDPNIMVIIYPSLVQGETAAENIAKMIQVANARRECDVLIVGRGGGSLEDLWAFNEEVVARAIFNSDLPIISAVGHEVDFTISDFVADVRAATPSAAAELVSRSRLEQQSELQGQIERLNMAIDYFVMKKQNKLQQLLHQFDILHPKNQLAEKRERLNALQNSLEKTITSIVRMRQDQHNSLSNRLYLQHPKVKLTEQFNRLSQLKDRLENRVNEQLNQKIRKLELMQFKIERHNPQQAITEAEHQINYALQKMQSLMSSNVKEQQERLNQHHKNMTQHMVETLTQKDHQYALIASKLHGVSPLATLDRGYSITLNEKQKAVRSVKELKVNEMMTTRLKSGEILSQIVKIKRS